MKNYDEAVRREWMSELLWRSTTKMPPTDDTWLGCSELVELIEGQFVRQKQRPCHIANISIHHNGSHSGFYFVTTGRDTHWPWFAICDEEAELIKQELRKLLEEGGQ